MKTRYTTLLLLLGCFLTVLAQKSSEKLYPFYEDYCYGYLNNKGEEVIAPKYRSAAEFSEGLAAVRENGTYGYINLQGKLVIPYTYDNAEAFDNGIAMVILDGKTYAIDTTGTILFNHNYKFITPFNKYEVATASFSKDSVGLINTTGKLIIPIANQKISDFNNGVAIVSKRMPDPTDPKKEWKYQEALMNTKGELVVPFGTYITIDDTPENGIYRVLIKSTDKKTYGYIDTKGKLLYTVSEENKPWEFTYGGAYFADGLLKVDIPIPNSYNDYTGYIDTKGKLKFSDKGWNNGTRFHKKRAFIKNEHNNYFLIDSNGNILTNYPIEELLFDTSKPSNNPDVFENELQFVRTENSIAGINRDGNIIKELIPKKDQQLYDAKLVGNLIQTIYVKEGYHYGIWNTKKDIEIPAIYDNINIIDNNMIMVQQRDTISYINNKGRVLWTENTTLPKPTTLNITHKVIAYFTAASPKETSPKSAGGWGGSSNLFKAISQNTLFKKDTLSALLQVAKDSNTLYIANTKTNDFYFSAQDSQLDITIQAKDSQNQWRDISYIENSWCGNSYHTLYLKSMHYWNFIFPKFEGDFKTKIRVKIAYKPTLKAEEETLYSNEIEASVNPGQFWKSTYTKPRF